MKRLLIICALAVPVLNIPIWAYGWMYLHWPNLLAGFLYLLLSLVITLIATKIYSAIFKDNPIFGCAFMLSFLPGLYLGLFLVSPYLQLTLYERATPASWSEPRTDQQFFDFENATVQSELQTIHRERRRAKSGDQARYYEATFSVTPITSAEWQSGDPVHYWAAYEDDEARSFPSGKLWGLRLIKPDKGFQKALKATKLPITESATLLAITEDYDSVLKEKLEALMLWLGLYNLIFLLLAGVSHFFQRKR